MKVQIEVVKVVVSLDPERGKVVRAQDRERNFTYDGPADSELVVRLAGRSEAFFLAELVRDPFAVGGGCALLLGEEVLARWAQKAQLRWLAANPYHADHGCRYCGSARSGPEDCALAKCKACGSVTCSDAGMSGRCPVCMIGITDYWSGHARPCGYKGCSDQAVAKASRIRNVCAQHASRAGSSLKGQSVAAYIAAKIEARVALFELLALGSR